MAMIGLTGSILVFRTELDNFFAPPEAKVQYAGPVQPAFTTVLANIQAAYPDANPKSTIYPTQSFPAFKTTLAGQNSVVVFSDAVSGRILADTSSENWLSWTRSLHANLLMGRTGRVVNGFGAAFLLLLCLTGAIIWWPGLSRWKRSLTGTVSGSWKRINFYFHSAAGFWSLAILLVWGITGVYFAWPRETTAFVARFSPVHNVRPPKINIDPSEKPQTADLGAALAQLAAKNPGMKLTRINFPAGENAPITAVMLPNDATSPTSATFFYLHPASYRVIKSWRRTASASFGDFFVTLTHPIHFGTSWGFIVKLFWAFFGLSLPVLFTTGALMYWNRTLRRQWSRLKGQRAVQFDLPPVR